MTILDQNQMNGLRTTDQLLDCGEMHQGKCSKTWKTVLEKHDVVLASQFLLVRRFSQYVSILKSFDSEI